MELAWMHGFTVCMLRLHGVIQCEDARKGRRSCKKQTEFIENVERQGSPAVRIAFL